MVRLIEIHTYIWSDGTTIDSNLSSNVFEEKYKNLRTLRKILQLYDNGLDLYDRFIAKIDNILTSTVFTGEITFSEDEKLLLYLIRQFGFISAKNIAKYFSKYTPRLIHVGEDSYMYQGWHIEYFEDENGCTGVWACIDPNGNYDTSDDSLQNAKKTVDAILFSTMTKELRR